MTELTHAKQERLNPKQVDSGDRSLNRGNQRVWKITLSVSAS
ncbi:MAG: hypothetical protein JWO91_2517 [Acidobacteriaceae bacterium]|nr:hypothetical protein [Acidobacteriaceae bacterium]